MRYFILALPVSLLFIFIVSGCCIRRAQSPYKPVTAKLVYRTEQKCVDATITSGRFNGTVLRFDSEFIKKIKELP